MTEAEKQAFLLADSESKTNTETGDDSADISISDEVTSTIGSAIKVVSVIVIIFSVIGSFVIMSNTGVVVGVAALISSVLIGLVAFGIGEICTLLTRMDYQLSNFYKDVK